MKRCSQCDFVYEDDQARCDMDGGELVYGHTIYPAAETAMVVAQPPMKFRSRSFILTVAATVIMGSFLGLGFFGFSGRSQSSSSPAAPAEPVSVQPSIVQPAMAATSSETSPSPDTTPSSETTPSSKTTPSTHKSTETPAANVKSRNAVASASSSVKPAPAASRSPVTRETKPAPTKREDDSKVGSILKKTGRILKKPFRKW